MLSLGSLTLEGRWQDQLPPGAVGQVPTRRRPPLDHEHRGSASLGLADESSLSRDSTVKMRRFAKDFKSNCSRHGSGRKKLVFSLLQLLPFDHVWLVIKGKTSPTKAPNIHFTGSPFSSSPCSRALAAPQKAASLQTPVSLQRKYRRQDVSRTQLPSP